MRITHYIGKGICLDCHGLYTTETITFTNTNSNIGPDEKIWNVDIENKWNSCCDTGINRFDGWSPQGSKEIFTNKCTVNLTKSRKSNLDILNGLGIVTCCVLAINNDTNWAGLKWIAPSIEISLILLSKGFIINLTSR